MVKIVCNQLNKKSDGPEARLTKL